MVRKRSPVRVRKPAFLNGTPPVSSAGKMALMKDSSDAITLQIDSAHRVMLERLAGSSNSSSEAAAEELLHSAIEAAAVGADRATDLLDSIPGAWERTQRAHEQYERGEAVPLSEL